MKVMMTIGALLATLPAPLLSYEERLMVRRYAETENEREEREIWEMYSELDEYGFEEPPMQVKVRDGSHSKRHSTITYYKGLSSYGAGSSIALVKRRARRSERRVGKEMIREQVYS